MSIVQRLIELNSKISLDDLVFENDPRVGSLAKNDPFAFLLAASLDRGMKAETAWRLPRRLQHVLGHLDPTKIAEMTEVEILTALKQIDGKPRYLSDAPRTIREVADQVVHKYQGDARELWRGQSASTVKQRMMSFFGVGPGIAAMVAILLDKHKEITLGPKDYEGMDPKPDVHVQRVFARLALCDSNPSEAEVIATARRLHPSYPGELDGPCWRIGRTWCHAERPDCPNCPMNDLCPKKY